jgi:hypothetical protein
VASAEPVDLGPVEPLEQQPVVLAHRRRRDVVGDGVAPEGVSDADRRRGQSQLVARDLDRLARVPVSVARPRRVALAPPARTTRVPTLGRAARLSLAVALLPHELVHYLALRPWSESVRVDLAPPRSEARGVPLARLGGRFDPAIPLAVLRFAAVAPTVVWPLVAVAVGLLGPPLPGAVSLGLVVTLAAWASPSAGDLAVFLDARTVRAGGSLDRRGPSPRLADPLSALLTVGSTLAVAGALLL